MSRELNTRTVVLLHGLGRTRWSMLPLAWRLGWLGFRCQRIGYASTRQSMAQSLDEVQRLIAQIGGMVHLVGHSLGGLLSARLLRDGALPIARVVQLGSPNLGSPAADRLAGTWPVRRLCGPTLDELQQHAEVPEAHAAIGAIAGTRGLPVPGIDIAEPHDGIVSRTSAWAGAGHRTSLPALHSFIPASRGVARLTGHFLTHGTFPKGHA